MWFDKKQSVDGDGVICITDAFWKRWKALSGDEANESHTFP